MNCEAASQNAQAHPIGDRHLCKDADVRCCMACLSADGWLCAVAGAGVRIRLAIAVAPVWVWGAVISALPHKEERFLYPVYPLVGTPSHNPGEVQHASNSPMCICTMIWHHARHSLSIALSDCDADCVKYHVQVCLSAAMTLAALPVMAKGTLGCLLPRQAVQWVARLAPRLACCAILALSLSRVAALLLNYGAPMQVYRQLPQVRKFYDNTLTVLYLLSFCIMSPASCPACIGA